jgi:hypothetical protein
VHQPLEGIAAADERLGRPFPLPQIALPLARWVEVTECGSGAEVAWNLDDSRAGTPGRLALYAGPEPPPARDLPDGSEPQTSDGIVWRTAPLPEAQPALRPVHELSWKAGGLHLRLTAQGPWDEAALRAIVAAIPIGSVG